MAKIFLSHSSKDKSLARKIAEDLKNQDMDVWFDEWEILVGDPITQKIDTGLEECKFVAVLLTKNSVESGWVAKEWQSKIGREATEKMVFVLPLKADDCRIPQLLIDKRYADFSRDYNQGINELIASVKKRTTLEKPHSFEALLVSKNFSNERVDSNDNHVKIKAEQNASLSFLYTLFDVKNVNDLVSCIVVASDKLDDRSTNRMLLEALPYIEGALIIDPVIEALSKRFEDFDWSDLKKKLKNTKEPWNSKENRLLEILVHLTHNKPTWYRKFGLNLYITYLELPNYIGESKNDCTYKALDAVSRLNDPSAVQGLKKLISDDFSGNEGIWENYQARILQVLNQLNLSRS